MELHPCQGEKIPFGYPLRAFICLFFKMHDEIQIPNTSETLDTQKLEKAIFMNFEKRASYKKEWWEKKGKKYHRITIRLEKDDFEKLERISIN